MSSNRLKTLASQFKAVAVVGPRQSGKTTLVRSLFSDKPYVSLENPDQRNFALEDPRGFLSEYKEGAVLDEIQRTPALFSYLQQVLDESTKKGLFILSGSNNFLLQESITQSLAGRVGMLTLPPFSYLEIEEALRDNSDNQLILEGFYPPIHDQRIPAQVWIQDYIRTYVERDVRQIKNVNDLIVFSRFMALLAGRTSQELNMQSLSIEVGVDVKTIQSWIGILESSYIIFLLKPFHHNFNKTVIKRPKVYFYDTAIPCSLLGLTNPEQIKLHPFRGSLFENLVVAEMLKIKLFKGDRNPYSFWRDKMGHEVDLIEESNNKFIPAEIKSGQTIQNEHFKNLLYWNKLSGAKKGYVLYAGTEHQSRSNGIDFINWRSYLQQVQNQP